MLSYTKLAKKFSKNDQNLEALWQISSATTHRAFDPVLNVNTSEPGVITFRGYPDLLTMYRHAKNQVEEANNIFVQIWNDIAEDVGAPQVEWNYSENTSQMD